MMNELHSIYVILMTFACNYSLARLSIKDIKRSGRHVNLHQSLPNAKIQRIHLPFCPEEYAQKFVPRSQRERMAENILVSESGIE